MCHSNVHMCYSHVSNQQIFRIRPEKPSKHYEEEIMEDIMTEQLNVDSIDMVDHDNADDDEYSMEIRNDSGESFDDGISLLPSEPVSIS